MKAVVIGLVLVVTVIVATSSPVTTRYLADYIIYQLVFNPFWLIVGIGGVALAWALARRRA